MFWTIFLFVSCILFYWYCKKQRPSRYPPGPIPLPLFGNILQVGADPHKVFFEYSKQYGPIVSVDMGLEKAVVIHGAKLIKEAFNEISMTGRPSKESAQFIVGDKSGIALGEGDSWAEQRRFTLRNLRDFGFGKNTMEEYIMEEVTEFIDWLKKKNGEPVSLHRRFSLAVVNSLWRILSGERYSHDDAKLVQILDELDASSNALFQFDSSKSLIIFFYPGVAKFFPNWSGWNNLIEIGKDRIAMFQRIVTEHKKSLPEDNPRDFVDVYLQEVKRTNDPSSSFHSNTADKALISVISDLFTAGSDTTSTTLGWIMLYLLHNREAQIKMQQEIDAAVGKSRVPSLSDRKSLPYCEAVIMEVMRISSIAAVGVPHCTTEDTQFHGYTIPKGTTIFGNLWASHHDPEIWGDPENFRPERFLTSDGQTVQKHDALLPFSIGKRVCLGETLARDTLFLFSTCLIQNFDLLFEPGKPKPTFDVKRTLTLAPKPYTLIMKERT